MQDDVENPTEITRTDRPAGSGPVCDTDLDPEDAASTVDATWSEVFTACCVKTPKEWLMSLVGFVSILFFMYFFLVGLDFIGTGAKVMAGCAAGSLFPEEINPIAGLTVGVLATVLLQSSSTTTSLVISLVGSGVISTKQGIYFIMGANIGTTVTNTLVSLVHLGVPDEIERAFAGATIHDAFNYLTVAILLPVEVATGYLFHLTEAMVKNYQPQKGEEWEGPISKYIEPIGMYLLIENKKVTEAVANGGSCDDFYPIGK
jgi:solute carrier family 34 (sodium-dependent phosphate cotransporter)